MAFGNDLLYESTHHCEGTSTLLYSVSKLNFGSNGQICGPTRSLSLYLKVWYASICGWSQCKNKVLSNLSSLIAYSTSQSSKDLNKSSASLVLDGELFKIYFDEDINLNRVKDTLEKKLDKLNKEMGRINQRLANKNFVEKSPAELIDQEKTNFNNLEKDVKKIQLTLENL